jgi:hypothetical protein
LSARNAIPRSGIKQANKHVLMAAMTYNLKKYLKFISKKTKTKAGVVCEIQTKATTSLKTAFNGLKNTFSRLFNFTNHNFFPKINLA